MKRNAKTSFIFIALLCLGACSFGGNTQPLTDLPTVADVAGQYRVKNGDSLMINVWGEPRLSGEAGVREDGQLSMPLVGDIRAEGKTLPALSKDIEGKLKDFVTTASVSISVIQSAPVRYYLSGSFLKPGEYFSAEAISFLQAIATGGGFAPFANTSAIIIIRKSDAGELRYRLNYKSVISGTEPNPVIFPGDIIAVE